MKAKLITMSLVAGVATIGLTAFIFRTLGRSRNVPAYSPNIPKTWDVGAMAELELPLADHKGSPKHISADYYYRIPVRPLYKSYPVYASGQEPQGYMDWVRQQEPHTIFDAS